MQRRKKTGSAWEGGQLFFSVQFSVWAVPGSVGCSVVGHDFSGLPTSDPKKRNSSPKVLRPRQTGFQVILGFQPRAWAPDSPLAQLSGLF